MATSIITITDGSDVYEVDVDEQIKSRINCYGGSVTVPEDFMTSTLHLYNFAGLTFLGKAFCNILILQDIKTPKLVLPATLTTISTLVDNDGATTDVHLVLEEGFKAKELRIVRIANEVVIPDSLSDIDSLHVICPNAYVVLPTTLSVIGLTLFLGKYGTRLPKRLLVSDTFFIDNIQIDSLSNIKSPIPTDAKIKTLSLDTYLDHFNTKHMDRLLLGFNDYKRGRAANVKANFEKSIGHSFLTYLEKADGRKYPNLMGYMDRIPGIFTLPTYPKVSTFTHWEITDYGDDEDGEDVDF